MKQEGRATDDVIKDLEKRHQDSIQSLHEYDKEKRRQLLHEIHHNRVREKTAVEEATEELEGSLQSLKEELNTTSAAKTRLSSEKATLSLKNKKVKTMLEKLEAQIQRLQNQQANQTQYSKELRWKDGSNEVVVPMSTQAVYRASWAMVAGLYDASNGHRQHAATIMETFMKNHLITEATAGLTYVLTREQHNEYMVLTRMAQRIGRHGDIIVQNSKQIHFWVASQVLATIITPYDAPPYGTETRSVSDLSGIGLKSLITARPNAELLLTSEGDKGEYWHDEKSEYKNKVEVKHPELRLRVTGSWLTGVFTTAMPDTKWVDKHVQQEGHKYVHSLYYNVYIKHCPLETNNDHVKVKIRTWEAPGGAVPTSLDGRVQNDGGEDGGEEPDDDDSAIPDAEDSASKKAMHWRLVDTTRAKMWTHCLERFKAFILHRKRAREQSNSYEQCKKTLKAGAVMIILDFAMNYSHEYMKEAQLQFFRKTQTTILPVVVWYMENGELKQRSYVYLSPDCKHSNNFVQHVLNQVSRAGEARRKVGQLTLFPSLCVCLTNQVVKDVGSILEGQGDNLTHVHIWSDGCGGQFKNRYQLRYIIDMVKKSGLTTNENNTPINIEMVEHNFFASCHGKGPCDSLGAVVKTILRSAMKEDIELRNATEAFAYLVGRHVIGEGDDQGRWPREFRFVNLGEVDHDKREEVGKVDGIKSCHCFRTINGDNELHAAEVSCYCGGCCNPLLINGDYVELCDTVKSGARAAPTVKSVLTEAQRARETREGWRDAFLHGVNILRGCQPGDWVLVYYDESTRMYWNESAINLGEPSWATSGMFKVAEVANLPELPSEDAVASLRTRDHSLEVHLFMATEVSADCEYSFPDASICSKVGKRVKNRTYATWRECGYSEEKGHKCKHACEYAVANIVAKVAKPAPSGNEERITLDDGFLQGVKSLMAQRRKDYGLFYDDPLIVSAAQS